MEACFRHLHSHGSFLFNIGGFTICTTFSDIGKLYHSALAAAQTLVLTEESCSLRFVVVFAQYYVLFRKLDQHRLCWCQQEALVCGSCLEVWSFRAPQLFLDTSDKRIWTSNLLDFKLSSKVFWLTCREPLLFYNVVCDFRHSYWNTYSYASRHSIIQIPWGSLLIMLGFMQPHLLTAPGIGYAVRLILVCCTFMWLG